jgi:hypothetical protein
LTEPSLPAGADLRRARANILCICVEFSESASDRHEQAMH